MKHLINTLVLSGSLAALAPLAHATPIAINVSIAGSDSFNATSLTFNSGTVTSGMLNGTAIPAGTALTFPTPTITFTPGGTINPAALIVMASGVNFYVTSETPTYIAGAAGGFSNLIISGTGYFTENGFDQTNGTFSFTSQEAFGTTTGSMTQGSFSSSGFSNPAATPEPSSLILLGTGVLGAAGMLRRRFTGKSNA